MHMSLDKIVVGNPIVNALEEQLMAYYEQDSPELRIYYTQQVTILLDNREFAGLRMLLGLESCPKHPIFLNEVLIAIINSKGNVYEKLHLIQELLKNDRLLSFLKSFPENIFCKTQSLYIDYKSAITASLSQVDILKIFIEKCGKNAVIKGALQPAVSSANIEALKLLLPACEATETINQLASKCNQKIRENQIYIARLQHMQKIINNNLSHMSKTKYAVSKSPESKKIGEEYMDAVSTDAHLDVTEMILGGRFNEAKKFLSNIDKSKAPWSKYEYLYKYLLNSITKNAKLYKQDALDLMQFLFQDAKFKNVWQTIGQDTSEIVINNDIDVMLFFISIDNGKTIAKSEALYNAVTHVNIPMFERLMQNSEVVAGCDSERLVATLERRLKHYGCDEKLQQQKQVLDLLYDRSLQLQTTGSTRKVLKRPSV